MAIVFVVILLLFEIHALFRKGFILRFIEDGLEECEKILSKAPRFEYVKEDFEMSLGIIGIVAATNAVFYFIFHAFMLNVDPYIYPTLTMILIQVLIIFFTKSQDYEEVSNIEDAKKLIYNLQSKVDKTFIKYLSNLLEIIYLSYLFYIILYN